MKSGFYRSCGFAILLIVVFSCSDPVVDSDKSGGITGEFYSLADGRGGSFSGGSGNGSGDTTQYQPGVITAGEWNDNRNWDYWKDLLSKEEYANDLDGWGVNPASRLAVKLTDSFGRSLIDASVQVKGSSGELLWQCRTDNFGNAFLWPKLLGANKQPEQLVIDYFGSKFTYPASSISENLSTIKLPIIRDQIDDADIAFVVDATGSMGDELEYLKAELNDVLIRAAQNNCSNWKIGSVFYRDEGDEYVTKVFPFGTSAPSAVNFIKQQKADGGGDWPEAVHTAMNEALNLNWTNKARTRLLFLVLDAPPHKEASVINNLKKLIPSAAQKGIKVIPIVASGIDKDTEFLMRSWSLVTNGTYVFITDHSGIGNDHLEPTVGEYTVEKLNNLLVRLIYQYTSCTSE